MVISAEELGKYVCVVISAEELGKYVWTVGMHRIAICIILQEPDSTG